MSMDSDKELELGSAVLHKASLFSIMREDEERYRKLSSPNQGHAKIK